MQPYMDPFEPLKVFVLEKRVPRLVLPANQTPRAVLHIPAVRANAGYGSIFSSHMLLFEANPMVHENQAPLLSISRGLEKLLVHYYPLAGRLQVPNMGVNMEHGKFDLICNGQGAVFVEAQANISLKELECLDKVYWSQLHCDHVSVSTTEVSPLVVQVTMLSCGAFVLSIQVLQSLLDSAGMLHFLHAWSAFTKSHSPYTSIVMPIWAGLVPSHLSQWPQKFHFPSLEAIKIPAEYIPADGHMGLEDTESGYHFYHQNSNADHHLHHFDGLEHSLHDSTSLQSDDHRIMLHSEIRDESFHKNLLGLSNASISLDYLSSLKKSLNVNCNKFEALAALIWRERTRMMDFPPSTEVVLFFPVPMKHDAHLAFYGQYGFNCMVSTHAGNLLQSGINEVVLMIQEARMHYSKQFLNCMRKFCQMHLASKRAPPHALIFTVLWYGAEEIDFGTRVAPAAADATRLPSPVNVIAVTGGLEHTIELAMTNVPADFPDQLSFISYGRSTIRSESKL